MTNFKIYLYGNKFIFGYIKEWEQISREYRESKDYTCEHRSIHIENSKLLILNSNILLKNEKSFFLFFCPHTLTVRLEALCLSGFQW